MNFRNEIISSDWHHTVEADTILQTLYNTDGTRKQFGILDHPNVSSDIEEVSYKLCFVGRSGIGKTTAIKILAGDSKNVAGYIETSGIRKTCIYWPAKVWDKVIMFKLHCWEYGDINGKKYSHIVPACHDKADIIVIVFSFNEPTSLSDVENILYRLDEGPARIVLGVRYNPYVTMPVKLSEVQDLANRFQIDIATLDESEIPEGISEMARITPVLNAFCQTLWKRDQDYILMRMKGIQV